MPDNQTKPLIAFEQMVDPSTIPAEELPKYQKGAEALMDLGWPSYYIDLRMIDRYFRGLVPRFQGFESFTEYQRDLRDEES